MKQVSQREIFIETEQLVFIKTKEQKKYPACQICSGKSNMFPPALIAEILRLSSREIYRRIEEGKVHFIEDDSFQLFVCSFSLAEAFKKRKKLIKGTKQ